MPNQEGDLLFPIGKSVIREEDAKFVFFRIFL